MDTNISYRNKLTSIKNFKNKVQDSIKQLERKKHQINIIKLKMISTKEQLDNLTIKKSVYRKVKYQVKFKEILVKIDLHK